MEDKNNLNPDESIFRSPQNEPEFKDFDEDVSTQSPKEVLKEKIEDEEEKNLTPPDFEEDETMSIKPNDPLNESSSFDYQSYTNEDITHWEETNDDNSVVKKYIVYVSKDYVPYIDKLSLDERSAFINDALEMKINNQNINKEREYKKRILLHLFVAFIVICTTLPIALIGVHKAIMATFENYKYSQDNFEKLYRQKFEKDKAYMRSLQYNKMMEKKNKQ